MRNGFMRTGDSPSRFASLLNFGLSSRVWLRLGPLGAAVASARDREPSGAVPCFIALPLANRRMASRSRSGAQVGVIGADMIEARSFAAALIMRNAFGRAAASFGRTTRTQLAAAARVGAETPQ